MQQAARTDAQSAQPLEQAQRVGPAFSVDGMLAVRQATRRAIAQIAAGVRPGMIEEDAVEMAKGVLRDAGLALSWHPTRVRFGRNTTKPMRLASEPGVVLGENDIFFIDIAPRMDAFEGDGGAAFVVGEQPEYARCAADAEALFHALRRLWLSEGLTGRQLYEHGRQWASARGWVLNFDLPGHRVSDFPHAAIHTGSLAEFDAAPLPLRWILEIHLRHPSEPFGAFFEDMLLEDAFFA
ncbi:M24 family metallopeptidase [Herbaspirillum sp. WKF16]|jgi:Xaa-Pro aminopeptidase|uniref:M24 family metallopeptidase n=1 Tax=Herbaspirillum sp. WKF16 TaxID=3028312 RepID=UPI0023A9F98C|nr:M24 family metallopeptidase [Herbaspirillum sp. WKF16]WDZ96175.1 M24 family metallopeptidase [Herbaspirillum sp. WKF16]